MVMVFVAQTGRERIATGWWTTVGVWRWSHRARMTGGNLFWSWIPHETVAVWIETVERSSSSTKHLLTATWRRSIRLLLLLWLLLRLLLGRCLWLLLLLLLMILSRLVLLLRLLRPVSWSGLWVEDAWLWWISGCCCWIVCIVHHMVLWIGSSTGWRWSRSGRTRRLVGTAGPFCRHGGWWCGRWKLRWIRITFLQRTLANQRTFHVCSCFHVHRNGCIRLFRNSNDRRNRGLAIW